MTKKLLVLVILTAALITLTTCRAASDLTMSQTEPEPPQETDVSQEPDFPGEIGVIANGCSTTDETLDEPGVAEHEQETETLDYQHDDHRVAIYDYDRDSDYVIAQTNQDDFTARHFGGFTTPFFYENNILPFITYTFPTVPILGGVAGRPPGRILIETELPRLTYWYHLPGPFEDGLHFFSQRMGNSGFERVYSMNVKLDPYIDPTENCIVYKKNNVYISIENRGELAYWLPGTDAIFIRVALIGEGSYSDSEHVQTNFFEHELVDYFGRFPHVPSFRHLIPKPVSIMIEGNQSMHTFVFDMYNKDIQSFMDDFSALLIDSGFMARDNVPIQRGYFSFSVPGVVYAISSVAIAIETLTAENNSHFVYLRVFSNPWW